MSPGTLTPIAATRATGIEGMGEMGGAIVSCGEVGKLGAYAVGINGNQVHIAIQQDVKPVVVTFRPNGTLLGSGPIQVNGYA